MTRDEAVKLSKDIGHKYEWYEYEVRLLEALGLIRFEEKRVIVSFRSENYSTGLKIKVDDEVVYNSKD